MTKNQAQNHTINEMPNLFLKLAKSRVRFAHPGMACYVTLVAKH